MTNPTKYRRLTMKTEQIKKQLIVLSEMLHEMLEERTEASAVYPESHWLIKDIDEDILLCSLSMNDLRAALYMESK